MIFLLNLFWRKLYQKFLNSKRAWICMILYSSLTTCCKSVEFTMSNKWNEMKYVSVKWSVAYFFCNVLFIHPGLPWCGLKLVMTKEKLRTKSSHYLRRQQFYCLFFISLLTLLEKWTLIPRVYSSLSDSRDELRYSLSIYHLTGVFSVFDHGKQQIKITVANFWTPYRLVQWFFNTNEVSEKEENEWEND